MSATVIRNKFAPLATSTFSEPQRRSWFWPAMALIGFGGSGVCFSVGILFAAGTAFGLIPASHLAAYLDVAILLAAFMLAFLGAHALDRDGEFRRKQERKVITAKASTIVDLTSAKKRLSQQK